MNQRILAEGLKFISHPDRLAAEARKQSTPEELMFDKAEVAEQLEAARETLRLQIQQLEAKVEQAEGDERKQIKAKIQSSKERLDKLLKVEPSENIRRD